MLAYTRATCRTASSVRVQLLLNVLSEATPARGGLGFYTYVGPSMNGAAATFEELRLDQPRQLQ